MFCGSFGIIYKKCGDDQVLSHSYVHPQLGAMEQNCHNDTAVTLFLEYV